MANTGATNRDQRATGYFEATRSLVGELKKAILAISCNRLVDFEESLGEQEILTARLRDLHRQLWRRDDSDSRPRLSDKELAKKIAAGSSELHELTCVYEAVLKSSSHSATLMASLLDSSKGHFQEASGHRLKYQTWSCQM